MPDHHHCGEYLAKLTDKTENAVLRALAGRTLADSLNELRAIDRASDTPTSEPALVWSVPMPPAVAPTIKPHTP